MELDLMLFKPYFSCIIRAVYDILTEFLFNGICELLSCLQVTKMC